MEREIFCFAGHPGYARGPSGRAPKRANPWAIFFHPVGVFRIGLRRSKARRGAPNAFEAEKSERYYKQALSCTHAPNGAQAQRIPQVRHYLVADGAVRLSAGVGEPGEFQ